MTRKTHIKRTRRVLGFGIAALFGTMSLLGAGVLGLGSTAAQALTLPPPPHFHMSTATTLNVPSSVSVAWVQNVAPAIVTSAFGTVTAGIVTITVNGNVVCTYPAGVANPCSYAYPAGSDTVEASYSDGSGGFYLPSSTTLTVTAQKLSCDIWAQVSGNTAPWNPPLADATMSCVAGPPAGYSESDPTPTGYLVLSCAGRQDNFNLVPGPGETNRAWFVPGTTLWTIAPNQAPVNLYGACGDVGSASFTYLGDANYNPVAPLGPYSGNPFSWFF